MDADAPNIPGKQVVGQNSNKDIFDPLDLGDLQAPAPGGPAATTPTAPGTTLGAAQSAPDALAGVVGQLREELAAQRAENAALRKTIEALTATLAKLAGAGAGND